MTSKTEPDRATLDGGGLGVMILRARMAVDRAAYRHDPNEASYRDRVMLLCWRATLADELARLVSDAVDIGGEGYLAGAGLVDKVNQWRATVDHAEFERWRRLAEAAEDERSAIEGFPW